MKNNVPKPGRNRNLTLWLVGGVYLLYCAFQLIAKPLQDPALGRGKWLFPAIGLLFAAAGLYLVLSSVKRYHARQAEEESESPGRESDPEPPGTSADPDQR